MKKNRFTSKFFAFLTIVILMVALALANATIPASAGSNAQTTDCVNIADRNTKLDCATALYFANGAGLSGIKAYFSSLGVTWDELVVGDPFQPDAIALADGSPRIWGALVKGKNVKVSGNACLVTDVPDRIANFGWAFVDDRYAPKPPVGHYGNATSVSELVELAIHADCTDWPENVVAMNHPGVVYKPYPEGSGLPAITPIVPTAQPPAPPATATSDVMATDVAKYEATNDAKSTEVAAKWTQTAVAVEMTMSAMSTDIAQYEATHNAVFNATATPTLTPIVAPVPIAPEKPNDGIFGGIVRFALDIRASWPVWLTIVGLIVAVILLAIFRRRHANP